MKTTIELPEPLFRRAKVLAAQRHISFKQLVVEGLERVTETPAPQRAPVVLSPEDAEIFVLDERGVPVLRKRDVVVTNELINQMREELGI